MCQHTFDPNVFQCNLKCVYASQAQIGAVTALDIISMKGGGVGLKPDGTIPLDVIKQTGYVDHTSLDNKDTLLTKLEQICQKWSHVTIPGEADELAIKTLSKLKDSLKGAVDDSFEAQFISATRKCYLVGLDYEEAHKQQGDNFEYFEDEIPLVNSAFEPVIDTLQEKMGVSSLMYSIVIRMVLASGMSSLLSGAGR